jgi:hypothetical protein
MSWATCKTAVRCSCRRDNDVPAAFAFASPANKAAVGPVQRFAAMLQNQAYRGLLKHADAATLQQAQPDDNTYVEVVKITPGPAGGACWGLQLSRHTLHTYTQHGWCKP